MEDPFAELRDINKAQIYLVNVLVTSIPFWQILIPIIIYFARVKKNLDANKARGTTFQMAWVWMLVGHAVAYTPTVALWGPSYLSEKWLRIYKKTKEYGTKMHWYIAIGTMTLLFADLIYTTEPNQSDRAANVWVTILIYCEIELIVWWAVPHYKLDQGSELLYMWEFIKSNQKKFDDAVTMNDGDANEIPDDVTELLIHPFDF